MENQGQDCVEFNTERKARIDRELPLSVVRHAHLLEISRGAVYYQSRPSSERDLALMRRIDELNRPGI